MNKRISAAAMAAVMGASVVSAIPVQAAGGQTENDTIVLRVCNWEEYIDLGGEGSYEYDYEVNEDGSAPPIIEDFEEWYEETYGTPIRVEYSTFGTNEDMYNQLQLGDTYDLLCPSEYMIMKKITISATSPPTSGICSRATASTRKMRTTPRPGATMPQVTCGA